jgi:hypothetical protein
MNKQFAKENKLAIAQGQKTSASFLSVSGTNTHAVGVGVHIQTPCLYLLETHTHRVTQ